MNAEEMTSEMEINDVVKYLRPQNEKEATPRIEGRRFATRPDHNPIAADNVVYYRVKDRRQSVRHLKRVVRQRSNMTRESNG